MKRHAKHIATGGVVAPTALGLAAVIANEIQSLAGLDLHGTGLAIYIGAFLLGASAVLHGQLRLEAQRLIAELGSPGGLDLGDLLGGLGGLLGGEAGAGEKTSPGVEGPGPVAPPGPLGVPGSGSPPPPSPPPVEGPGA